MMNSFFASFQVTVQSGLPAIASLSASPSSIDNSGNDLLTLTASGLSTPSGHIDHVDFYRDANGNGVYEPSADLYVGESSVAAGQTSVSWSGYVGGLTPGTETFFAIAVSYSTSDTFYSNIAATTVNVTAAPTIPPAAFPVSDQIQVAGAIQSTDQIGGQLLADAAGNFRAFWQQQYVSTNAPPPTYHTQKFDAAGHLVGLPEQLSTPVGTDGVSYAMTPDGSFAAVWETYVNGVSSIYAQWYNPTGSTIGSLITIVPNTAAGGGLGPVAVDGNGNMLIVWSQGDFFAEDIYAMSVSRAGTVTRAPWLVNSHTNGSQGSPTVALNSNGVGVIAWDDDNQQQIVARQVSNYGLSDSAEFVVYSGGLDVDSPMASAVNNSGNFILAWSAYGDNPSSPFDTGIYARRYGSNGQPTSAAFQVNTFVGTNQTRPWVALNDAGLSVIGWESYGQDPSDPSGDDGAYAQVYNPQGNTAGPVFSLPSLLPYAQDLYGLNLSSQNALTAAWTNDGSDNPGLDTGYFRQFTINLPPAFSGPTIFTATADSAAGTVVGNVQATDPLGNQLTYTLLGNTPFAIDPNSGQITVQNAAALSSRQNLPSSFVLPVSISNSGTPSLSAAENVTINVNSPPTVRITGLATARPGQSLGYTLGAFEPSLSTDQAGFTYHISWGDNTPTQTASGLDGLQVTHTFAANGTYTIQATATDDNNKTSLVATYPVTITTTDVAIQQLFATGGSTSSTSYSVVPGLATTVSLASAQTVDISSVLNFYGPYTNSNFNYLFANILVDGSTVGNTGIASIPPNGGYNQHLSLPLHALVNLSAGTHSIAVEWLSYYGYDIGLNSSSSLTLTASTPLPGAAAPVATQQVSSNGSSTSSTTYSVVPGLSTTVSLASAQTVAISSVLNFYEPYSDNTTDTLGAAIFVDGAAVAAPEYTTLTPYSGYNIFAADPLNDVVSLSPGTHTVAVEWLSSNSHTIDENPSSLTITAYNPLPGGAAPVTTQQLTTSGGSTASSSYSVVPGLSTSLSLATSQTVDINSILDVSSSATPPTYLIAAIAIDGSTIDSKIVYLYGDEVAVQLHDAVTLPAGSHTIQVEWASDYGYSLGLGTSSSLSVIAYNPVVPASAYVNANWAGDSPGQIIADADPVTAGSQPAVYGLDAFSSVNSAIAAVAPGGTIYVNSGSYSKEAVNLTNGDTLKLLGTGPTTASPATFGSLTGASGTTLDTGTIGGLANFLQVGSLGASTLFAGVLSGPGSLTIQGGALILGGTNTYTGPTTINSGGTLQVGNGGNGSTLGTGAVFDDGSLVFDLGGSVNVAAPISGTGSLSLTSTLGAITQTAAITVPTLTANASTGIILTNAGNAVSTFSANNSASGDVSLTNTGALAIAGISQGGGNVDIQTTAALTVVSNAVVASASGTLSLAADINVDGTGNSTTGKLSIQSGAVVVSANTSANAITVRGYDIDIDASANPAVVGTQRTFSTTPAPFITSGLHEPFGLAFDKHGNLFIANLSNNTVSEVAAGATTATPVITSGLLFPNDLAFDQHGNLFIANPGNNTISEVAAGTTTATPVITSGLSSPVGLAFDKHGNLFIANSGTNTVSEVAAGTTTVTPFITSGLVDPVTLAFDPSGNLFLTSGTSTGTLYEVTAGGSTATPILSGLGHPFGLAIDQSGNVFIASADTNTVVEVAAGTTTATPFITSGLVHPLGLAFDQTGALFIANGNNNTVSKVPPPLTRAGGVVIRSSLASDPMSIGGGNSDVSGINLTDAELAQIQTMAAGSITFGDASQTGNITFQTATPATTAGASLVVQQSTSGSGAIVLDDQGTGAALNGNGGIVSLSAGNGGIVAASANNAFTEIATAGTVTLNTNGPIGTSTNRIQFDPANRPANVVIGNTSQPSSVYLDGLVSLAQSTVSATSASVAAGSLDTVTLRVLDVYLGQETNGGLPVAFQVGGGGSLSAVTDNGDGTYSTAFSANTTGVYTITATINGQSVTPDAAVITVTPDVANHLAFETSPTNPRAGQPIAPVKVDVLDRFGNLVTGASGNIAVALNTPPAGVSLTGTLIAPVVSGVATFSNLAINVAGTYNLAAASSSALVGATTNVIVAPTTHFSITSAVSTTTAGAFFNVTVTALDGLNHQDGSYRGTIHFSSTDMKAALPSDYTFAVADNGKHTFTTIVLKTVAPIGQKGQTITVSDVASPLAKGISAAVTVTPATASSLSVTGFASPTVAGAPHTLTVTALDAFGNRATSYTGKVQISSSDSAAVLPSGSFALGNGLGSFSATLKTVGAQSLTVQDASNNSIQGTQTNINVVSAAVTRLSIIGNNIPLPTSTTAGQSFTVTVTAFDALSRPDTQFRDLVHFTSTDNQFVLPDYQFALADQGVKTFTITLKTAGSQSITVTDLIRPTLKVISTAIMVAPATVNSFSVSGFPSPTVVGVAHPFMVKAMDAFNNQVTNYSGRVQFSSNDGAAVLPSGTFALTHGVGTFSAALTTQASQSLTVRDSVESTITGTQSGITVVSSATHFSITSNGVPLASLTAGQQVTIKVVALNANTTDTAFQDLVRFGSTDNQFVLPDYQFVAADQGVKTFIITLKTAGSRTITVADLVRSAITTTTAAVTVNPAAASSLSISGFPSPTLASAPHLFTVTALDAFGNRATSYTGKVQISSSDSAAVLPVGNFALSRGLGNFTATLKTAGSQSLTARDTANPSLQGTQSSINVAHLSGAVSGPSSGVRGQPLSFTLTANEDGTSPGTVFTYQVNWADGSAPQTISGPGGTIVAHAFLGTGNFIPKVTATDRAGNVSAQAAAPTVAIQAMAIQTDPADSSKTALVIGGTTGNDAIVITAADVAGHTVTVAINGIVQAGGPFAPSGHILVYGQGGVDTVQLAAKTFGTQTALVAVPALLFAGSGGSTLSATGSSANNVLVGGAGNDTLTAGTGRDLLIGDAGADTLHGGSGDDVLIGGGTAYDANLPALLALSAEWGRTDRSYSQRVHDLFGDGLGGLNGRFLFDSSSILHDTMSNQFFGGSGIGLEWFWFSANATQTDKLNTIGNAEILTFE